MMPIDHDQTQMRQLSADRRSVRTELPGLPVEGMPEPLRVKIDFDAGSIDQMIERLLVLRAQMLPAPLAPRSATEFSYGAGGTLRRELVRDRTEA
jgi:hypothetical protein